MALVRALTHVAAPPGRVWDLVLDWEGSVDWMVDASVCEVLPGPRNAPGMRIRSVARPVGVPLVDTMTVTRIVPGRLVEMVHTGWPVRGVGWFEVLPTAHGAVFEWGEELDPPMGPLGEIGAAVLRPAIEAMLRRSVANFKRLAERGTGALRPGAMKPRRETFR